MKLYLIAFFLFLLSACKTDDTSSSKVLLSTPKKLSLTEFKEKVAPGDILLKRGKGPISQTIVRELKETIPLSHCAIVAETDSLVLINSISGSLAEKDGLQLTSLENFYADAFPESIYIIRAFDSTKIYKIEREAIRLYNKNIPFDHDFNHLDSSKLYCSEFVEYVLYNIYQTTFFGKKKWKNRTLLTFNELLYSDSFFIVNQKSEN